MNRRVVPPLALLALLVATLPGAPNATARKPPAKAPKIGFSSAIVVDPVHTFGEPDVRIGADGTTHVSGPWGTGTQRSIWNVSTDGGRTYHTMHDAPLNTSAESATRHLGPGGGDTEIMIDHNGLVYYSDLAALVTLKNATWNPKTKELQTSFISDGSSNINGIDRQWMALWDPPNVAAARRASGYDGPFPVNYQTWNAATTSSRCETPALDSCSLASYTLDGLEYVEPTVVWPMENDGNPVIDQLTGTVIQAVSTADSSNDLYADIGAAIVTRDKAGNATDPALRKFEVIKIADLPADGTTEASDDQMNTRDLFPVTAIDDAGNAYAIYITRAGGPAHLDRNAWQVFYSYASRASGWKKWSAPRKISRPPSRTNIMPWAVAGSAGRLAVVWYGTEDDTANPSATDIHQPWDVYLAMVEKANTPRPKVEQVKVTRHPMHYGTICLEGTGCIASAGNRNLADFFMVEKDPRDGAVVIVYDDTSNELTQNLPPGGPQISPPIDGVVDHRGAPVVTVMRQNRGIGLFGRPVHGPPAVGSAMGDSAGDALFDPIYGTTNLPGVDLRNVTAKRRGDELEIKMQVADLAARGDAAAATGGGISYVARWVGGEVDSGTGVRDPIYFAAAEFDDPGVFAPGVGDPSGLTYFGGLAQSVELCSVSGCFPHIIEYPRPPLSNTEIQGEIVEGAGSRPDTLVFHVPLSLVGNPAPGTFLESFSVFAFARARPSNLPVTNLEGELGITPVMIDGICCTDVRV